MTLLGKITRGKVRAPYRMLVWGTAGVGKTTLASQAPAPVFLPVEEGCNNVDVARLPQPADWPEIIGAVRSLTTEPHDFKTLVIDTLNAAEPLCWAEVCRRGNKPDIEAFGYGKGYVAALDEWRVLLAALELLQRQRGMNLILIAHSQQKAFRNPEGEDFDVWRLALNEQASGLIRGWCEEVLLVKWEVFAAQEGKKPAKGISTGNRLLHTQENGPWQAKNRHSLPPTLPLDWRTLAAHMAADGAAPAEVRRRIEEALKGVEGDVKTKTETALAEAGDDLVKLISTEQWLAKKRS